MLSHWLEVFCRAVGQCSLVVERLLRKQKVAGSIPVVGSLYMQYLKEVLTKHILL